MALRSLLHTAACVLLAAAAIGLGGPVDLLAVGLAFLAAGLAVG